jgi:predicted lysophospholipase L1 biosynthesis ABC-type transport system permease subunit
MTKSTDLITSFTLVPAVLPVPSDAHHSCAVLGSGSSHIRRNFVWPAKLLLGLSVNAMPVIVALVLGAMVDSIAFDVNWIIASAVIGLLVAVVGALLYPRGDCD